MGNLISFLHFLDRDISIDSHVLVFCQDIFPLFLCQFFLNQKKTPYLVRSQFQENQFFFQIEAPPLILYDCLGFEKKFDLPQEKGCFFLSRKLLLHFKKSNLIQFDAIIPFQKKELKAFYYFFSDGDEKEKGNELFNLFGDDLKFFLSFWQNSSFFFKPSFFDVLGALSSQHVEKLWFCLHGFEKHKVSPLSVFHFLTHSFSQLISEKSNGFSLPFPLKKFLEPFFPCKEKVQIFLLQAFEIEWNLKRSPQPFQTLFFSLLGAFYADV